MIETTINMAELVCSMLKFLAVISGLFTCFMVTLVLACDDGSSLVNWWGQFQRREGTVVFKTETACQQQIGCIVLMRIVDLNLVLCYFPMSLQIAEVLSTCMSA